MTSDQTQKIANNNSKIGVLINIFDNASFALPIWVIFFHDHFGITLDQAIFLGVTRWIAAALFEVPTGAWADMFGRVKILRIGFFGYALSLVPFLLVKNFWVLFIVQIIGGFFAALTSGVLGPLVQDGYKLAKAPDKAYKHYLSNINIGLYLSRLISGIIGAWVYSKYIFAPYMLEIFFLILAFILTLNLYEMRLEKSTAKTNSEHMKQAFKYLMNHKYLRNFILITLLYTLFTESLWSSLQPLFEFNKIPVAWFGVMFAVFAASGAIGAYLSRKVLGKFDGMIIRKYMTLGAFVAITLVQFSYLPTIIAGLVLLGLGSGFANANSSHTIQEHAGSSHQSTVISIYSLLVTGFYGVASVSGGWLIQNFGVSNYLHILLVETVVLTGIVLIIIHTTLTKSTAKN